MGGDALEGEREEGAMSQRRKGGSQTAIGEPEFRAPHRRLPRSQSDVEEGGGLVHLRGPALGQGPRVAGIPMPWVGCESEPQARTVGMSAAAMVSWGRGMIWVPVLLTHRGEGPGHD